MKDQIPPWQCPLDVPYVFRLRVNGSLELRIRDLVSCLLKRALQELNGLRILLLEDKLVERLQIHCIPEKRSYPEKPECGRPRIPPFCSSFFQKLESATRHLRDSHSVEIHDYVPDAHGILLSGIQDTQTPTLPVRPFPDAG